jgi:hypothetical protein
MADTPVKPADADDNSTATKTKAKSQSRSRSRSKSTSKRKSGDSVSTATDRKPYKDIDGNEIDAPVIPSFERDLQDAQNRADEADIADISERYHKARDEKVKRDNDFEKKRRAEQKGDN